MNIREGLIPTVLGTAVSATGYALKQNRKVNSMVANTCSLDALKKSDFHLFSGSCPF